MDRFSIDGAVARVTFRRHTEATGSVWNRRSPLTTEPTLLCRSRPRGIAGGTAKPIWRHTVHPLTARTPFRVDANANANNQPPGRESGRIPGRAAAGSEWRPHGRGKATGRPRRAAEEMYRAYRADAFRGGAAARGRGRARGGLTRIARVYKGGSTTVLPIPCTTVVREAGCGSGGMTCQEPTGLSDYGIRDATWSYASFGPCAAPQGGRRAAAGSGQRRPSGTRAPQPLTCDRRRRL